MYRHLLFLHICSTQHFVEMVRSAFSLKNGLHAGLDEITRFDYSGGSLAKGDGVASSADILKLCLSIRRENKMNGPTLYGSPAVGVEVNDHDI